MSYNSRNMLWRSCTTRQHRWLRTFKAEFGTSVFSTWQVSLIKSILCFNKTILWKIHSRCTDTCVADLGPRDVVVSGKLTGLAVHWSWTWHPFLFLSFARAAPCSFGETSHLRCVADLSFVWNSRAEPCLEWASPGNPVALVSANWPIAFLCPQRLVQSAQVVQKSVFLWGGLLGLWVSTRKHKAPVFATGGHFATVREACLKSKN